MNQSLPGSYKAYSRANHTVGKTRQVVMLYDGAIRFLQQADEAIARKDFETRYHKLTRASDILVGLQAALDFEAGGKTAKILYDFYAAIDMRLFALHRSNDSKACKEIIAELRQMRDVWDQIDRGDQAKADAAAEAAKPAESGDETLTVSA